MKCAYRFVLEVHTLEGRLLQSAAISPDWEPALEATRLAGLRSHGVWQQPDGEDPAIEPLWADAGQPLMQGARVHMEYLGHTWFVDFRATHYFGDTARAVVAALLADGQLRETDQYRFGLSAYAVEAEPAHRWLWRTKEQPQQMPVRLRRFGPLVTRSHRCGESDPSDVEVVLPEDVLDDICALTLEAGDCETGGILLGHVCRDTWRDDIGLEITAQVRARHTEADVAKVTFTSDTWTDVRAAVALRNAGELMVGFWHSHPAHGWCRNCPVERQMVCQLGTGFLSADDKALHRAMFPAAYTQALVITRSVRGLETKNFGWRQGVLEPRGFLLSPGETRRPRARESLAPAASASGAACEERKEPAPSQNSPGPGLEPRRPAALKDRPTSSESCPKESIHATTPAS